MRATSLIIIGILASVFWICPSIVRAEKPVYKELPEPQNVYKERYRPQFHYTTKKGWINDPCGLVYFDGEYHIFNDHNPFGLGIPGHLGHGNKPPSRWSHAVTKDLVHWEELPIAILPDKLGAVFSGSGIVDKENTAGFGKNAIVLCYTSAGVPFSQSLSYSNDRGRTWIRYEKNPVVPNQKVDGYERDPRVFWHEPTKRWVMGLHLKKGHARFFNSPNLKDWTKTFDFRHPSIPDCPDLFKLLLDGNAKTEKWILYGGGFRYFVGAFDGRSFKTEAGPIRGDWGGNFYAAQTWTNPPDGRRVQISWMAGGRYPGMPFNQQQSFPCELKLVTTAAGPRLTRWPVKEIEKLYQGEPKTLADLTLKAGGENPLSGVSGELFDIELTFKPGKTSVFNLNMHNQSVTWTAGQLTVFGRKAALPVADDGTVSLHILLDRTSIETFGNKGLLSMTSCILPKDLKTDLAISVTGDDVLMKSIVVRKLRSAWEY